MPRARTVLAAIALAGCTRSEPTPSSPAPLAAPPPAAAASPPAHTPPRDPAAAPSTASSCEGRIEAYLAARAELGTCTRDSDCAQMWPGLCPHGPYYVHREREVAAVVAMERAIEQSCSLPECEPPIELPMARCDAGRCVAGRSPATSTCWDFRETNLEADGVAQGHTATRMVGTTPQLVIAPAHAGTLVLELDWPQRCSDCTLRISEHNSGMSRLVTPTRSESAAQRNGETVRRERLELPVTPGPYHMIAMASTEVPFSVRATLTRAGGGTAAVTRHGVDWQRMCED
ncbi:MAG: hypothetical protein K1X88_14355 [Nannocystaceae bacterium]|nr:hypothetical protein [Nannocystaceae bacterium]